MDIRFLGCGNMSSIKYRNSQILIGINKDNTLLFDCGTDTKFNFHENGIKPHDIKNVFISHSHGDHIGGLEYLGFMTYFTPYYKDKPNLYANHNVMRDLWNKSLCGGMESLEKRQLKNGEDEANLKTYFNRFFIKDNNGFNIGRINFTPIQTIHVVSGTSFMHSYGLQFISDKGKKVFVSGDTQYSPSQLAGVLEDADIIFHDCETSQFPSKVHAHYDELNLLPNNIKNKMYLYHYGDEVDDEFRDRAIKDGFAGFVQNGGRYDI